ncbi:MAG: rhomboid family intramembrane serine protease, partial [Nannocystaceae bacterium]
MDLNHVLLWIIPLSMFPWWLRLQRTTGWKWTGWSVVGALVLAAWGAGLAWYPDHAGIVAGGLWFVFIALPQLGARAIMKLTGRQNFRVASRVSRVVACLHPADGWWTHTRALDVLALLQEGKLDKAQAQSERLGRDESPIGRFAHLQTMRAQNRWPEMLEWVETHPRSAALLADEMTRGPYLRALGELGRTSQMLELCAIGENLPTAPDALLPLLGLSGQVDAVDELFSGPLGMYKPEVQAYWRATTRQAAGETKAAQQALEPLKNSSDALIRAGVAWRLESPLAKVDVSALDPAHAGVLQALARQAHRLSVRHRAQREQERANRPWMTLVLLGLEGLAFAAELPGGAENPQNLVELGAMIGPLSLLDGEYWRLFTAGFLHFGWLHLGLNAAGIFFFGRLLEQAIGAIRFGLLYVVASVGAMGILLAVNEMTSGEPFLIVGASASLMGIVGALLAVSLKRLW